MNNQAAAPVKEKWGNFEFNPDINFVSDFEEQAKKLRSNFSILDQEEAEEEEKEIPEPEDLKIKFEKDEEITFVTENKIPSLSVSFDILEANNPLRREEQSFDLTEKNQIILSWKYETSNDRFASKQCNSQGNICQVFDSTINNQNNLVIKQSNWINDHFYLLFFL